LRIYHRRLPRCIGEIRDEKKTAKHGTSGVYHG
jgi:hypothetical protein